MFPQVLSGGIAIYTSRYVIYNILRDIMQENTTISVRVPRPLRIRMRKLGIKPTGMVLKAIEEEINRRTILELKKEIAKHKKALSKIPMEEVVRGIREDRER